MTLCLGTSVVTEREWTFLGSGLLLSSPLPTNLWYPHFHATALQPLQAGYYHFLSNYWFKLVVKIAFKKHHYTPQELDMKEILVETEAHGRDSYWSGFIRKNSEYTGNDPIIIQQRVRSIPWYTNVQELLKPPQGGLHMSS